MMMDSAFANGAGARCASGLARRAPRLGMVLALLHGVAAAGGAGGDLPLMPQRQMLTAPSPSGSDRFGIDIAVQGDLMVIGAREALSAQGLRAGAAHVYERVNGEWMQTAVLANPTPQTSDWFGEKVALSGDTLLVTAPTDYMAEDRRGALHVFTRGESGFAHSARIVSPAPHEFARFGDAMAVDGDRALVSQRGSSQSPARVFIFERIDGVWTGTGELAPAPGRSGGFALWLALQGDLAFVGDVFYRVTPDRPSGAVHVYRRDEAGWAFAETITPSDAGLTHKNFSERFTVRGGRLLVGAPRDDEHGIGSGAAYLFERAGDAWVERAKLTASDAREGSAFGIDVELTNGGAYIGAGFVDGRYIYTGAVYRFELDGAPVETAKLFSGLDTPFANFGYSLVALDDQLIVGSPQSANTDGDHPRGAVHIFGPPCSGADPALAITREPGDVDALRGDAVSFRVEAHTGFTFSPPAYQWRRNGVPLENGGHVIGVRTPWLRLSNTRLADAGVYDAVITGPCETRVSRSATLSLECTPCCADFSGNALVDATDLGVMLGVWGPCAGGGADCDSDLNGDGVVNGADLAIMLGAWGPCS